MNCPYKDIDCPWVDTAGMSKLKECKDCEHRPPRIGLAIVCTGKYDRFLQPLIDSAERHFFTGENYDIYVFTDAPTRPIEAARATIYPVEVQHHPFPIIALEMYKFLTENKGLFRTEYLFTIDADMLFVGDVGEEILGELVAVLHPGFWKHGWGDRKTTPASTAYLGPSKWYNYVTGAFEGGRTKVFLEAARTIWDNILTDYGKAAIMGYTDNSGCLAQMHDESHWNWYVKQHPVKLLSPSYCYPEMWSVPFEPRILALKKKLKEVR